jgi:tripartite ATP-independent transporter DctP family solute receptor
MNKSTSLFVVGLLVGTVLASAIFAGIGSRQATQGAGGAVRTLRAANNVAAVHPVHVGMEHMAKRLTELSGGRLKLELFPSEQLGNDIQTLEQAQAGTLAITKVSASALGNFVSRMKVFSLPYLFRDEKHYWQTLDGEIGSGLLDTLSNNDSGQPSGIRGLCYLDAGSRNFYSQQPIKSPHDVRGKKFRVMSDPIAMDMVQALGGSPAPIPFGELYTSLKQGVVDGAENNPPSYVTSRHFEICRHFTFDHHARIPDLLVISDKIWKSLTTEEQGWLRQAAQEASRFQRNLWESETEKAIKAMKAEGVSIHEVDLEAFRTRTRSVRQRHGIGPLGDLMRSIEGIR